MGILLYRNQLHRLRFSHLVPQMPTHAVARPRSGLYPSMSPHPRPSLTAPIYSVEDIEGAAASGEISEAMVVAEGEERTSWFVWLLVACTSISGLLFGTYMHIFHA